MNRTQIYQYLKQDLKKLGKAVVAYSGGVNSTFLLEAVHSALGKNCIAVTARFNASPDPHFFEMQEYTRRLGILHIIVEEKMQGSQDALFYRNAVLAQALKMADEFNIQHVIEGSDLADARHGFDGVPGVLSPLRKWGLTGDDVRLLSKELMLPIWDKISPPYPSYSPAEMQAEVKERLNRLEAAERYLHNLGFREVRVYQHEGIARVGVGWRERHRFLDPAVMNKVNDALTELGFSSVAMDLQASQTLYAVSGSQFAVLGEREGGSCFFQW